MSDVGFSSGDECGEKQEADGDWYCNDGEVELEVGKVRADDDKELDSKCEEEEEIKLEESDVNLEGGQPGVLVGCYLELGYDLLGK